MIERKEQSSELTVERPRSFTGLSMAEICGAYLEFDLRKTRV